MDGPARVGRYEVELVLGQGPIGRSLLARDPVVGRHVVIKVLRPDLPLDAGARAARVERVRLDVRAAAAFSHPSLAVLHDMGEDDVSGRFFVFEFLQGTTLREASSQGPLPRGDAARLARSLGTALALAHGAGLVHGDVKPDNVMLAAGGPKLLDLGFGAPPGLDLLDPSPACTPPEVLGGSPCGPLGDQFSLAATLYAAITGKPPFTGADAASIAAAVTSSKHPAPTSVLAELRACPHIDTIFDRALSKDPRRRFPACDAFAAALAGSLESAHAPLLTPISQSSIVPRATRRWQNAAAAAAVFVIFALVLLGRQPRNQGVSLKSVASAFATAIGAVHPPHRPRSIGVSPGASASPATAERPPARSSEATGADADHEADAPH
jgi:serine/threonine protein kinase